MFDTRKSPVVEKVEDLSIEESKQYQEYIKEISVLKIKIKKNIIAALHLKSENLNYFIQEAIELYAKSIACYERNFDFIDEIKKDIQHYRESGRPEISFLYLNRHLIIAKYDSQAYFIELKKSRDELADFLSNHVKTARKWLDKAINLDKTKLKIEATPEGAIKKLEKIIAMCKQAILAKEQELNLPDYKLEKSLEDIDRKKSCANFMFVPFEQSQMDNYFLERLFTPEYEEMDNPSVDADNFYDEIEPFLQKKQLQLTELQKTISEKSTSLPKPQAVSALSSHRFYQPPESKKPLDSKTPSSKSNVNPVIFFSISD